MRVSFTGFAESFGHLPSPLSHFPPEQRQRHLEGLAQGQRGETSKDAGVLVKDPGAAGDHGDSQQPVGRPGFARGVHPLLQLRRGQRERVARFGR